MKSKGFTLIELLVVIAIIGILSSVVLASLNTARNKGADAAIKADLANARAAAENFYDDGSTYDGVCAADILPMSEGATDAGSADVDCLDTGDTGVQAEDAWAMSAQLKSDTSAYWCVDSTGASKETTGAATDTVCE